MANRRLGRGGELRAPFSCQVPGVFTPGEDDSGVFWKALPAPNVSEVSARSIARMAFEIIPAVVVKSQADAWLTEAGQLHSIATRVDAHQVKPVSMPPPQRFGLPNFSM